MPRIKTRLKDFSIGGGLTDPPTKDSKKSKDAKERTKKVQDNTRVARQNVKGLAKLKGSEPIKKEIPTPKRYNENPDRDRPMKVGATANTWGNMAGNVGKYMFGVEDENLKESPYGPTKGFNISKKYYTRPGMREDVYNDLTSDKVKKDYNHTGEFNDIHKGLASKGEDRDHNANNSFPKNQAGYNGMYNEGHGSFKGEFNLGRYRTSAGEDKRGKYISFNDTYDWNGLPINNEDAIPFYDRIYEKEWNKYKETKAASLTGVTTIGEGIKKYNPNKKK